MGLAFVSILIIYGLVALALVRFVASRRAALIPWLLLALAALATGGMFSMLLALAMIGKGGSHIDYCPNLPAGHILECMPSWEGISLAAAIAALAAFAIMVLGSILMVAVAAAKGRARRHRSSNR